MAVWSIVFLPETDQDLQSLGAADATLPTRISEEIQALFKDPFKAARFEDALEGHARTSQIDRLSGSAFPQSFRLQLLQDYRATTWCLRTVRQVAIVHVFAKSADPSYRRAIVEHDARLEAYFLPFKEFVERAETRVKRRSRR